MKSSESKQLGTRSGEEKQLEDSVGWTPEKLETAKGLGTHLFSLWLHLSLHKK